MNIKKWMEYRIDFFIGIIAIFLTNVISIVFFWTIFQHIPILNGWKFEQLLFLVGLSFFCFGIWHVFLNGVSPHKIERYIMSGDFDRVLLKPINPMLLLLTTATFWIVRSGMLSQIFWSLMRFTELPLDIYNPFIMFILTFVLPFGFINYYPAQTFLGKGLWAYTAYLTPVIGLITFAIAYSIWKFGIKNYTSTGS